MQLGIIGLGRMGANMMRRLMKGGHDGVVYDRDAARVKELADEGAVGAADVESLVKNLEKPRAVWVMLPSGEITENTVSQLRGLLESGDVIIDGGNSYFKDDVRRGKLAAEKGIDYVDVGTSGGVWGAVTVSWSAVKTTCSLGWSRSSRRWRLGRATSR